MHTPIMTTPEVTWCDCDGLQKPKDLIRLNEAKAVASLAVKIQHSQDML